MDGKNRLLGLIHVVRDISAQKKLEYQLLHAQKMEAVGQLAGGIAHDFNNIITAVIGNVYILQMKLKSNDSLLTYLEEIRDSAEKAAHLTQSLLAFSRKQIMDPKPLGVNSLITKLHKLMARIVREDITLRKHLCDEEITVMADSGQLEQVIMNLVTNACDAMPNGGILTITTAIRDINEEYIRTHEIGVSGTYALISITDTGMGMDKRTRERMFEPFFTTKAVGKGTGLGLSIAFGIVQQHNGCIDCQSELGQGTTFNIYLPLVILEADETEESAVIPARGTETIFLVEDDTKVRETTMQFLKAFGYTVIEAVDGEDAVRKFKDSADTIDLLIVDVVMPKKNGREVFEEVKKLRPEIKALFTSGYPNEIINKRAILDENLNFIAKPATPDKLLSKIREILDTKQ
jgi:nitrogen-specific signal transduction histidine kinase/ActR/RegA family two-component response regulator